MRAVFAALSGGLFGVGLLISGMVDTEKVRGWLDVFGTWDPTLAFVMGGAILPMALAWSISRGRRPLLAGSFPAAPAPGLGRGLILGSVMFGVGWGLSGLCPGPALAASMFNGSGGVVFLGAMALGMWAAPTVRRRIAPTAPAE